MTGNIIFGLIVVVWLFVLGPLVMRGRKPVRHAGQAFDETRIVHRGGSVPEEPRRIHPPKRFEAVDEDPVEAEIVDEDLGDDGYLVDDRPRKVRGLFTRGRAVDRATQFGDDYVEDADFVDVDVVDLEDDNGVSRVSYPDSYLSPADMEPLPQVTRLTDVDSIDTAEAVDDDPNPRPIHDKTSRPSRRQEVEPLTPEEREFAARRSGRGGWDPDVEDKRRMDRYQRRRTILAGLASAIVATTAIAFVMGGNFWISPLIATILTCLYLVALRRQVFVEKRLHEQRINQLRRARLGVKNKNDAELIPAHLRRPGAIVVELDDESPDFAHLDSYEEQAAEPLFPSRTVVEMRPRRAG